MLPDPCSLPITSPAPLSYVALAVMEDFLPPMSVKFKVFTFPMIDDACSTAPCSVSKLVAQRDDTSGRPLDFGITTCDWINPTYL